MLYAQINKMIKAEDFEGMKVFSLHIPETSINQFLNHEFKSIVRVNSSTKYVEKYASNLSKVFGNTCSVDVWSYDPQFLEQFEETMRQKFEKNYIYINSSSVRFDNETDAFRLILKLKQ